MFVQLSVVSGDGEDFHFNIIVSSGGKNLNLKCPSFLNGLCGILLLMLVKKI